MERASPTRPTGWFLAVVGLIGAVVVLVLSRPESLVSKPPRTPPTVDLRGLTFTDATAEAGIGIAYSDRSLGGDDDMSSPIAVADLVGSPAPDLYVSRRGKPNSLYRNDGQGHFTDVAAEAGVAGPDPAIGSGPVAVADFDGDGCTDLYVTALGTGRDAFYRNTCHGRFEDRSTSSGIRLPPPDPQLGAQHHGVATADVDLDGDLDLFVASWDISAFTDPARPNITVCDDRGAATELDGGTNRSRLFLNDGDGQFGDATATMGLHLAGIAAFTPTFADFDEDGWPDLAITGDGCTSRLFHNDAGRGFVDITRAAGVGTDENGMGSVVKDFDGDGHLDWFVTSIFAPTDGGRCVSSSPFARCSGNRLYLGDGKGRFRDATDEFGLRDGGWGWGAALEDFAGVGRPQVLQLNGYRPNVSPSDRDSRRYFSRFINDATRFWVPTDTDRPPRFVDAARAVGLDHRGIDHSVVTADFDGDGDSDMAVAGSDGPTRYLRNDRPRGRRWLTIRLDDPSRPGNRVGIGARIAVTTRRGSTPVVGWITRDGAYESQQLPEFRVGLATTSVHRIEVRWPGQHTPQVVTDVPSDQVLVIQRATAN